MKSVKVSDLFDVKYGNSFELINLIEHTKLNQKSVNYISRTEKNNGISAFVEKSDIDPFPGGTITVAVGGSVLSTFLQKKPYYTGFHVLVLFPKQHMTEIELLFYCYCIRKNKYRYNYGRQANKTLKDIFVPASLPKEWKGFNIEELDNLKRDKIVNFNLELNPNKWERFDMIDLFDIKGSQTTSIQDLEEYGYGKYPFVTTQATNNGIEGFYSFYTEKGNILTVDSAVLGYCAYQPFDFSASDHVEKLIPKFDMDKYIALFLTTVLNREQYRYNYGRKASQTRLKERSIKLPSNNNKPDWDYMRNYIKSLPYSANL